jgi:hypothetical protein
VERERVAGRPKGAQPGYQAQRTSPGIGITSGLPIYTHPALSRYIAVLAEARGPPRFVLCCATGRGAAFLCRQLVSHQAYNEGELQMRAENSSPDWM